MRNFKKLHCHQMRIVQELEKDLECIVNKYKLSGQGSAFDNRLHKSCSVKSPLARRLATAAFLSKDPKILIFSMYSYDRGPDRTLRLCPETVSELNNA
jgi:hypothetical protein